VLDDVKIQGDASLIMRPIVTRARMESAPTGFCSQNPDWPAEKTVLLSLSRLIRGTPLTS